MAGLDVGHLSAHWERAQRFLAIAHDYLGQTTTRPDAEALGVRDGDSLTLLGVREGDSLMLFGGPAITVSEQEDWPPGWAGLPAGLLPGLGQGATLTLGKPTGGES